MGVWPRGMEGYGKGLISQGKKAGVCSVLRGEEDGFNGGRGDWRSD